MTDDQNEDGPRAPLSSPLTAQSGSGVVPVGLTRPWLPEALARTDRLAALEEDWDSYHASPPSEPSLAVVRSLVHMLSAWHTVAPKLAPQMVPTPEGGIDILWREQGYELEVEIAPDGRITGWLHRCADKAEVEW
jgi:hypothetical protein